MREGRKKKKRGKQQYVVTVHFTSVWSDNYWPEYDGAGKLVELGNVMNCGKFHFDHPNSLGSTGCLYMAFSKGKQNRRTLHCTAMHAVTSKHQAVF